jgi:hypothetical protein
VELVPEAGLRQTLRWQTDVLEAYDGTEQRIRLASLPRVAYQGAILLEDADLAAWRASLADDAGASFVLPHPWDAVASVNAITGTTITIDPTYVGDGSSASHWNAIGRTVYVRGPAGDAYTTAITNVAGGGATLTVADSPPSGSFPAGSTLVMPTEALALEDGQAFARYKAVAGTWNLAGRQSTARALSTYGAPALTTLGGLDVLDRRPTVDGLAAEQVLSGVTFQDAGGALASSAAWSHGKARRMFTWDIRGAGNAAYASERQWWRSFLTARKGRLATFRAPTWRPDLQLSTYTAGTATLRTVNSWANYLTRWWPSTAHRAIQLEMADGSFQRRTVTSATDVGGGLTELTVNANLTGSPADVRQLCLLETCRLDTDEVSIEWLKGSRGRLALSTIVVTG